MCYVIVMNKSFIVCERVRMNHRLSFFGNDHLQFKCCNLDGWMDEYFVCVGPVRMFTISNHFQIKINKINFFRSTILIFCHVCRGHLTNFSCVPHYVFTLCLYLSFALALLFTGKIGDNHRWFGRNNATAAIQW